MKVYCFVEELICVAEYWTTDLICWNLDPVFFHRELLNELCSVTLIQCLCAITHY